MPYIGKSPLHGNYSKLDDFSGDFDGSDATHALATNGTSVTPVTEAAVLISIDGVLQEPVTDYTVSGTNITFTTAPASGANFFGVVMGEQLAIGTPSDSTVTPAKMNITSALLPASADGAALGSASLEWSDLYLADGGVIYFGEDQDITVTHVHNDGLILKSIPTADDNPLVLTLQTGETTMVADEPIAQIHFQAPDESSGTDSILIAATIQATAEGAFSSSSNATSLDFLTGNSAAAGSDGGSMILGSTGNLTLKDLRTADGSSPTLTLQSGDTDIAVDDVLGKIAFQAPDEGAGTDAILVGAAIQAVSEGDFSSSNNATKLSFMTGASEAATEKMTISSTGDVVIKGVTPTLTIGDAGAEDTAIIFDGNAQDFHIGLDDTADSLVLGLGSALGTTTHMSFDATGAILKPLQPAFHGRNTSANTNQTGDATQYTIPFTTETFDKNSDYDGTTFTAPVTGTYLFVYAISLSGITSGHTNGRVEFKTSNRDYRNNRVNPYAVGDSDNWTLNGAIIADMDASDTAYVTIIVGGGSKVVDFGHDGSAGYTYFSGCLLQ